MSVETPLQAQPPASGPSPFDGPPAGPPEAAPPPAAAPKAPPYPPSPAGFFRGNDSRDWKTASHYFSPFRVILAFGTFTFWIWSSNWVNIDSRKLGVRNRFWNSLTLPAGIIGTLGVICLPLFLIGVLFQAMCIWGVLGFYIRERNDRVPDPLKVMTPRHIRNVTIRTLKKIGIEIGSAETQSQATGAPIRFIAKSSGPHGSDETFSSSNVEKSQGYLAAKELMYDSILRRATDVHLEPKEDQMAIRTRIDGVMYPVEPFEPTIGASVVNIFKVLSAMDITERRRPQDGSFRAELEGRQIDFRVATQGTRHGEKMTIRVLDQSSNVAKLDKIGLRKALMLQIKEIAQQPHGMFLSCGPTGAGKSTTLYAALHEIDVYQKNIITVEDPVEYRMDNVNQIEINTKAGQTFGASLRSILRQDPDVVMIGEIRDQETGQIACQAANTGHMVFSTVHANDTITALFRLLELGVEPFMVANSISAILGQRLARRLCPDCKVAYKPKPELLQKVGLPADKVDNFYRTPTPEEAEEPCSTCGGLGFRGRIGVFELLVITDNMRDMIRDKVPVSKIKNAARKNGMLYMKEEGLRLVVRGVTSMDEVLRVVK